LKFIVQELAIAHRFYNYGKAYGDINGKKRRYSLVDMLRVLSTSFPGDIEREEE